MKTPYFRTPYNCEDPIEWTNQTALECKDPTLTQQHFKDECDINILYARYLETNEMPQVLDGLSYGNFEGIFDFQTAMNSVRQAQGMFDQLPARIKNRFDNDPGKLLNFLNDQDNRDEAIFLGLLQKPTDQIPPREDLPTTTTPKPGSEDPGTAPGRPEIAPRKTTKKPAETDN